MAKRDFLGEFEHLVMLAVFQSGEIGGADVHAKLEKIARRDASLSAIYVTLARLERKGYVRSAAVATPVRAGRPRRLFSVTRSGATALRRTREALERLWADDTVTREP